jgi:hypothetical protein
MLAHRRTVLDKILSLDPEKDHQEIVKLTVLYEFPWDYNRAMELALYKTFAVPSIANVLHRSGEFKNNTQKRYDDTDILLSEMLENGYTSIKGRDAIEHMNWIHSHYPISNEDYLYVLSTFVFESARWINAYGYRKLTRNEELAGFKYWYEIGQLMGIKDIPETIEALEQYNIDYEKNKFVFAPENLKVATSTENLMLGWFLPKFLYPIGRPFLHAIMDDALLRSFNRKPASGFLKFLVRGSLKLRGKFLRLLPVRKTPLLRTTMIDHRYYPNGYQLSDLGPDKLKKAASCPFHKLTDTLKGAVANS